MDPMATDIIDHLLEDHRTVRSLFAQLDDLTPERRGDLFRVLVDALARHEAAEEVVVHPATRDQLEGGEAVARVVLEQESQAERLLSRMEGMEPADAGFYGAFRELRAQVLAHADHEERVEFPRLRETLDEEQLRSMAKGFRELKARGPTHPHPATPQTPEVRTAVAPIAAVFDRARDAAREVFRS
jgi:hemerythrin superfamily protein